MNEAFLHYIWKFRLLSNDLKTTANEPVTILHPGVLNSDGGPDFCNALVRIGNTTWAGNVEIHQRSSHWFVHNHHHDKAYRNVILHVVYEHDLEDDLVTSEGVIPTLVIRHKFPDRILQNYDAIKRSQRWIPCQQMLPDIAAHHFLLWAPALAVERLNLKSELLQRIFFESGSDLEETCYRWIAQFFGFRINALPFEILTRKVPYRVIIRQESGRHQIEAILFGVSGLIPTDLQDPYVLLLRNHFELFQTRYPVTPMDPSQWKFLRMRPVNFPTIRISQLSSLLEAARGNILSLLREIIDNPDIPTSYPCASGYWDNHYVFSHPAIYRNKRFGSSSWNLLRINGAIPFQYFEGILKGNSVEKERAFQMLENIPPESNNEIMQWEKVGLIPENALHTQALLQLHRNYCQSGRCLECRLGRQILSVTKSEKPTPACI